jgi:hypothetical protein
MSKRFGSLGFKGSTEEKLPSEPSQFGQRKAVNDKMVPDRVGSAEFLYYKNNSLGALSRLVLFVADLFHPLDDLAIERFLDGDMCHGRRRRSAMPMFLVRRK